MKKITFGPVEIGLSAILLLVAGIVGYQFADIKDESHETLANSDLQEQTEAPKEVAVKPVEKQPDEVKIPEAETTEETKVEAQAPPEATEITVSASARQSGSTVNVSATLSQPLTGTCRFMFKKQGYSVIEKSVTVSNSSSCETNIAPNDFPADGEWSIFVTFAGQDLMHKGYTKTSVNVKN